MAVRRQTGPSYGGGKNRPAYHQQAGSLRPPTNGSGPRNNNGWNGHGHSNVQYQNQNHNNRSRNFNPHHHNNFGGQSQAHPQNVNFRHYNPHHRQDRNFQNRQGGDFFNGPSDDQNFHNAIYEEQLRAPIPRGPKNRRRRNRQFETTLFNAVVQDIKMVDIVDTSNLDTDIEMPDAPPLECYQQNIVADGIAAANALLSQIEYFVRTGTMPFENGNFHLN
ncbi:hypothetical protein PoHVEF18_002362 [Penicillium ochrochloron]